MCDTDLYIWNLSCGFPGCLNGIHVMNISPYFQDILARKFPPASVTVNIGDEILNWLYISADGIYLSYKSFVKPLNEPGTPAERRFFLGNYLLGKRLKESSVSFSCILEF